jgi:hypothetical protein
MDNYVLTEEMAQIGAKYNVIHTIKLSSNDTNVNNNDLLSVTDINLTTKNKIIEQSFIGNLTQIYYTQNDNSTPLAIFTDVIETQVYEDGEKRTFTCGIWNIPLTSEFIEKITKINE